MTDQIEGSLEKTLGPIWEVIKKGDESLLLTPRHVGGKRCLQLLWLEPDHAEKIINEVNKISVISHRLGRNTAKLNPDLTECEIKAKLEAFDDALQEHIDFGRASGGSQFDGYSVILIKKITALKGCLKKLESGKEVEDGENILEKYKKKVIRLFKSGRATDVQWSQLANAILSVSDGIYFSKVSTIDAEIAPERSAG